MSVLYASISQALRSIYASQVILSYYSRVSVRSLTLSFNNTASRLCRASLAPLNPTQIFASINILL
jgi:hypothetical protein